MGNTASTSSSGAPHEWKASGPVGATQDLITSLQSNKETDASRARIMEAHIETRVAERLRALQTQEAATLKDAREKASEDAAPADNSITSHKVSTEVEALRKKLEARKQVKSLPEEVEAARGSLVKCLRENDRRPLNCWEEVEAFKEEVRRLEKGWVDKTLS